MAVALRHIPGVATTACAMLCLLTAGCQGSPTIDVDLQFDIVDALPQGTSQVKICVTDGVFETFGSAAGSYAVTGLFVDEEIEVTVNALDDQGIVLGITGPLVLTEAYTAAEFNAIGCESGGCVLCESSGRLPTATEETLVLGVRFVG